MTRTLLLLALALAGCPAPSTPQSSAPAGSTNAAPAQPQGSMREVDIAQFKADIDAGKAKVIIDVRTPGEYQAGHVPGTELLPVQELQARVAELEPHRGETIYLICQSGSRSASASRYLSSVGFDTVNVAGGTSAWRQAGLPVE